jgi:hypothetical protein
VRDVPVTSIAADALDTKPGFSTVTTYLPGASPSKRYRASPSVLVVELVFDPSRVRVTFARRTGARAPLGTLGARPARSVSIRPVMIPVC